MKNNVFMGLSIALVLALGYFIMTAGNSGKEEGASTPPPHAVTETNPASEGGSKQTMDVLTYVPEDTLLFSGGVEPAPLFSWLKGVVSQEDINDIINAAHRHYPKQVDDNVESADSSEQLESMAAPEQGSAVWMLFFGWIMEYLKVEHDPALAAKTLGIDEYFESALYTLGNTPILRLKVSDEEAFYRYLDASEVSGNVVSQRENIQGVDFRVYDFDIWLDDSDLWRDYKAYSTLHDGYGLLFLATPSQLENNFSKILGMEKPKNSLAQTDHLQALMQTYRFHPSALAYVNEQQIFNALTQPDGELDPMLYFYANMTSQSWLMDLMVLSDIKSAGAGLEGRTRQFLNKLRTPECHQDINQFTRFFPRSVMGYETIAFEQSPMDVDFQTITETDTALLQDIKGLRGFTPNVLRDFQSDAIFGFGLGLDVSAAVPLLTQFVQHITEAEYTCELLLDGQAMLRENSSQVVMGAAAISGVINGIKGLSFVVNDFATGLNEQTNKVEVTQLDAMLVLSVDNPATLIMMAGGFVPELGAINIPMDGSVAELPVPLPWSTKEKAMVAVKGKHIVVFMGEKATAQAEQLTAEAIDANSIMAMKLDVNALVTKANAAIEQDLQIKPKNDETVKIVQRVMKALSRFDTKMIYVYDIGSKGIEADALMLHQVKN